MVFYDSTGKATAYTEDGETIYLFTGEPVAYFYGDLIYNFRGKQLGRYKNGWIRDNSGFCVFFSENSNGGPAKPIKGIVPIKYVKQIKPLKSVRSIPFTRPVDRNGWSKLSGRNFFL